MRNWKLMLVPADAETQAWLAANPGWARITEKNGWLLLWMDPRCTEKIEREWPEARRMRLPKNRAASRMPARAFAALGAAPPGSSLTVREYIANLTGNDEFDEN